MWTALTPQTTTFDITSSKGTVPDFSYQRVSSEVVDDTYHVNFRNQSDGTHSPAGVGPVAYTDRLEISNQVDEVHRAFVELHELGAKHGVNGVQFQDAEPAALRFADDLLYTSDDVVRTRLTGGAADAIAGVAQRVLGLLKSL